MVLGGCHIHSHAEHHTATPPPTLCARCPQHGLSASPLLSLPLWPASASLFKAQSGVYMYSPVT